MTPEQQHLEILLSRDGRGGTLSAGVYLSGDLIAWVQFAANSLVIPTTTAYTDRVAEEVAKAGFDLLEAGRPEMVSRVREVLEETDAREKQIAALRATNAKLMEEICDLRERIRELEGEGV
jgi:NAD(P)H-flavin reductase